MYNERSYNIYARIYIYIYRRIVYLCVRSAFVYATSGGPNRGYPGTRRPDVRHGCGVHAYIIISTRTRAHTHCIYSTMHTHTHVYSSGDGNCSAVAAAAVARDTRLPLSTTTTTTPVSVRRTRDAYPIRATLCARLLLLYNNTYV